MKASTYLALTAAALLSVAPALDAADARPIRALLWTDGEDGPMSHALMAGIEDFEDANVGSPVSPEWVTPEVAEARLDSLVAAGNLPDVFMTSPARLAGLAAGGQALALDEVLARDDVWPGRVAPALMEPLRVAGHTYGIPVTQSAGFLYVNTGLLDAHGLTTPRSWTELLAAVGALANAGTTPIAFADKEGWEGVLLSQLVLAGFSDTDRPGEALSGGAAWTDPAILGRGNALAEMARSRPFPARFQDMTSDQATELFRRGKAGMLVSRDRLFAMLDFSDSAVKNQVDVAPVPGPWRGAQSGSWVGGPDLVLAISSRAADREGSVRLLKTYLSDDIQQPFSAHICLPAAREGLDDSLMVPLERRAVALLSRATRYTAYLDARLPAALLAPYAEAIRKILSGTPPADALAGLRPLGASSR